jgi:hypothetical protein
LEATSPAENNLVRADEGSARRRKLMLNNDVFVFDNAVHMYDLSDANIGRPDGHLDRAYHLRLGADRRPPGQEKIYGNGDPITSFARRWNETDLGRLLFDLRLARRESL